jgi:putative ABC transport system ATP-binding protein
VLALSHVVKHFKLGGEEPIRAVDDVTLSVRAGEFVAIFGPSGSGKTTLLELIAALRRPDSGAVLFEGRDVFAITKREREEYRLMQIGVIGHPMNLLPGATAIENASLKLWLMNAREARRRVEPLMERLGLAGRFSHRTEQLSMGERQRLLIAQALAGDPRMVLADEPTGNLDSGRTREVLGLLREVTRERGAAVVLMTHDREAAAFADCLYELRDGKLSVLRPGGAVELAG